MKRQIEITHDDANNVGYIDLCPGIGDAHVKSLEVAGAGPGGIVLDFNAEGQLVGIELLDAARLMPPRA